MTTSSTTHLLQAPLAATALLAILVLGCAKPEPHYTLEPPEQPSRSIGDVVIHNVALPAHRVELAQIKGVGGLIRGQSGNHNWEVSYIIDRSKVPHQEPIPVVVSVKFDGKDIPEKAKRSGDRAASSKNASCAAAGKCRVFVSSKAYPADIGGVVGADVKCQSLAETAQLGGTWMAWLGDQPTSPSHGFVLAPMCRTS